MGLLLLAAGAHGAPAWRTVSIPILPEGASLGGLWAGLSGDLYVWTESRGGKTRAAPWARLLHWNGEEWKVVLTLPGHYPASVFGTNNTNMFASANQGGRGALFRSTDQGVTWTPQVLPPESAGRSLGRIDGAYDSIQVVLDGVHLVRFDGVAWGTSLRGAPGDTGVVAFSFQGPNEGYLVNSRGWGRWIDGAWKFMPAEFGFRWARGLWGLRDRKGGLLLFAADDNRFSNGVRIWRFDALEEDFRVEFEESSDEEEGGVSGLWGSAEDDIYAIGRIGEGPGSGRIYHFDGTSWKRDNSMGPIPPPVGIHGTSRNDVWISLADGRLLHYSTAVAVSRKMSSTPSR